MTTIAKNSSTAKAIKTFFILNVLHSFADSAANSEARTPVATSLCRRVCPIPQPSQPATFHAGRTTPRLHDLPATNYRPTAATSELTLAETRSHDRPTEAPSTSLHHGSDHSSAVRVSGI